MAHWLWYCLTAVSDRAQPTKRVALTVTPGALSGKNVGEIAVSLPSTRGFDGGVAEGSEAAYTSAVESARLHHEAVREAVVHAIGQKAAMGT